jgi:dTDP-4-amino-4,6-dideoxygalactose transaminase
MNSRLDELQAALLLQRLPYLSAWTSKRRIIAQRYWQEISHPDFEHLDPPETPASHVHHLFVLRTSRRTALQSHLDKLGIRSLIHYPIPSHRQKAMGSYRTDPFGLPKTDLHAATCLSLPIHPFLTEQEVDRVIASCNAFS